MNNERRIVLSRARKRSHGGWRWGDALETKKTFQSDYTAFDSSPGGPAFDGRAPAG
jgi:hypothetical protein